MSAITPRELCQRFGYPRVLRDVLEQVVDASRRHLEPLGLRSVMLCGSVARGEVTWTEAADGATDLLSDVDAPLFARHRDPEREGALRAELHDLSGRLARSPLFHVDAGINRLYMKRHTVWTYEFRMAGVTLFGEDLRRLLPRVTRRSFDLGATAELALVRLWNQAQYTPVGLVRGDATPYERLVFAYVTARNTLELPTILLPHHGVLRDGYAARDAWLRANPPLAPEFGREFTALCAEALRMKRRPAPDPDPAARLRRFVEAWSSLLAHLARRSDPRAPADRPLHPLEEAYDHGLARAFLEQPLLRTRRLGFELGYRARKLRAGHAVAALGYDRPTLVRALLALHGALAAWLGGASAAAESRLSAGQSIAQELGLPSAAASGTWPDRWQALREDLVRTYAEVLYKGARSKAEACVAAARWRGDGSAPRL